MPDIHPLAGKPVAPSMLVNVPRLVTAYFAGRPDPDDRGAAGGVRHLRPSRLGAQRCLQRGAYPGDQPGDVRLPAPGGIDRPLFIGIDTHALCGAGAAPARWRCSPPTASTVMIDAARRLHADAGDLARHPHLQQGPHRAGLADGVVITPSHNPPEDGGFKYNPPNGGPADTDITGGIERAANALSRERPRGRQAHPLRARAQGGLRASLRLHHALCRRPRQCRRHGGDPRRPA